MLLERLRPKPNEVPPTEASDPIDPRRPLLAKLLIEPLEGSLGALSGPAESGAGMTSSDTRSRRGILPMPAVLPLSDPWLFAREADRRPVALPKLPTELDLCSGGSCRSSSNGRGGAYGNAEAGSVRRNSTIRECDKLRCRRRLKYWLG